MFNALSTRLHYNEQPPASAPNSNIETSSSDPHPQKTPKRHTSPTKQKRVTWKPDNFLEVWCPIYNHEQPEEDSPSVDELQHDSSNTSWSFEERGHPNDQQFANENTYNNSWSFEDLVRHYDLQTKLKRRKFANSSLPHTNLNYPIIIVQRPKGTQNNFQTMRSTSPSPLKSLHQRQKEYDQARAKIFNKKEVMHHPNNFHPP